MFRIVPLVNGNGYCLRWANNRLKMIPFKIQLSTELADDIRYILIDFKKFKFEVSYFSDTTF